MADKWGIIGLALMMFVLCGGVIWFATATNELPTQAAKIMGVGAGLLSAAMGVYAAMGAFKSATVLTADEVERRDLIAGRRMRRADIAGYRTLSGQNGFRRMKLYPKPAAGKGITITLHRPDTAFWTWFESIPDLAEEERKRAEQSVLEAPEYGSGPSERRLALKRFKMLARLLNGFGVVLFLWIWLRPEPYWLAIALGALAPLAALAVIAATGGRIALYSSDARPKLGWLMYAGIGVPLRAMFDVHLYHWQQALAPMAICAAACVLLSWLVDRRVAEKALLIGLYGLMSCAFAWGVVVEANALLDRPHRVHAFRTEVLSKSISSGQHTSYDLELARWGDRSASETVDVGREVYDAIPTRSAACVYLLPGSLQIRWFMVRACRSTPSGTRRRPTPPPP